MTQQRDETLRYRGRAWSLLGLPLAGCADPGVKDRLSQCKMQRTDLWRGYLGTWEIRAACLWLIDWRATVGERREPRGLSWLFPGRTGPVLADWFTGELHSPRGEAARAGMFETVWPKLRVFHVDRGRVLRTELRDNSAAYKAGKTAHRRLWAVLGSL